MRKPLELSDPHTLILSIWHQDERTAVIGNIRKADGSIEADAIQHAGGYIWQVVDEVLEDAKLLRMRNFFVLCNDAEAIGQYTGKIWIAPTETKKVHMVGTPSTKGRPQTPKGLIDVGYGGCPHMWNILYHAYMYDRWRFMHHEKLIKTRELWSLHNEK